MFLGGIEVVARGGGEDRDEQSSASGTVEEWKRVQLRPGVELHFQDGLPKLGDAELTELMARLEAALRENRR